MILKIVVHVNIFYKKIMGFYVFKNIAYNFMNKKIKQVMIFSLNFTSTTSTPEQIQISELVDLEKLQKYYGCPLYIDFENKIIEVLDEINENL